jgi:hypothetical protein
MEVASALRERRLSPLQKARLSREILFTYGRVRRGLRRRELPRLVDEIRSAPRGRSPFSRPLADGRRHGERLGDAVVRVLSALPLDARCLTRSLVLLGLLANRDTPAHLIIAVRPGGELELDAHAWIELEGHPLLVPAGEDYGRLLTL